VEENQAPPAHKPSRRLTQVAVPGKEAIGRGTEAGLIARFPVSEFPESWKNGKLETDSQVEFPALNLPLSHIKGGFSLAGPLFPEPLPLLGVTGFLQDLPDQITLVCLTLFPGEARHLVPKMRRGLFYPGGYEVSPVEVRIAGLPEQIIHAAIVQQA
jgi:hypothetical protein